MIINHNLNAMNAHRNMSFNTTQTGKSMEKLSSGLRINRAGDDAAGLAISEKMRGQIRGLDQASRNAQDGISLIQTAEGALNETHSILQRMRELSVQSSNDTNTDVDRDSIQSEISQLKDEIDRIGNTTEFNTKKLVDGSVGAKKVAGAENAAIIGTSVGKETSASVAITIDTTQIDAATAGDTATSTLKIDGANIDVTVDLSEYQAFSDGSGALSDGAGYAKKLAEDINKAIEAYNKANDTSISNVTVTESSGDVTIKSGSTGSTSTIDFLDDAGAAEIFGTAGDGTAADAATGSEGVFTAGGAGAVAAAQSLSGDAAKMTFTVDGKEISIDLTDATAGTNNFQGATTAAADGDMSTIATAIQTDLNKAIENYNKTVPTTEQVKDVTVTVKDGSFVIESGSEEATSSIKFDNSEAAQLLGVAKQNSSTQGGGLDFQIGANQTQTMKITIEDMRTDALGIKNIDLSTKAGAQEAVTKVNEAIEKVSAQRSNLGAVQNRLEHTINNLGTTSENLTAAESRVRDVDMAKEMMNFTKNNILNQAAQAMMAQSQSQPQAVLQLLR